MSETSYNGVAGRFFLIGCERSGTTLLQAMLASHSQVFSFPESHVFCRLVPRNSLYKRLGLANWRTAPAVIHELAERCLRRSDAQDRIPQRSPFLRSYVDSAERLIDESALQTGKNIWVEKTPHHLFQVETIGKLIPDAGFIHILRDGRDAAASIRDASLKDPDYWGSWSVEALAEHWNRSFQESLKSWGKSRHHFVTYESLIESPSEELDRVCRFMGLAFEPGMLEHWKATEQVTGWMYSKPWMDNAHRPIQDTRLAKYYKVFTADERGHLEQHLDGGGQTDTILGSPSIGVATGVK